MNIMMDCLGNKIGKFNHKLIGNFIKDKMQIEKCLYRGITMEELLSFKIQIGKKIKFKRITSFSKQKFIAEEFCCERYKTNVMLKVENAYAFNYSYYMTEILQSMIDEYESSNSIDEDKINKLYDNIGMVDYEEEFFLGLNSEFIVKSIEKVEDVYIVTIS